MKSDCREDQRWIYHLWWRNRGLRPEDSL